MTRHSGHVAEHLSREMGLTRKEFLRTLPAATAPLDYRIEQNLVTITHPAGRIEIRLQLAAERRLGAFRLPVIPMDFHFIGLDAGQRRQFLQRFDLYFQRGGG